MFFPLLFILQILVLFAKLWECTHTYTHTHTHTHNCWNFDWYRKESTNNFKEDCHIYIWLSKSWRMLYLIYLDQFPSGSSCKESACKGRRCKRHGFDPYVRKIPWRRAWQPTPVFLPRESSWTEESGWLQSMESQRVGHDWSDWT